MFYDFFKYFPSNVFNSIKETIIDENLKYLEEIRIRNNQKIIIKLTNNEIIIDYIISAKDILDILQNICENSIYSYQKEIGQGFITIRGGHRVGITR